MFFCFYTQHAEELGISYCAILHFQSFINIFVKRVMDTHKSSALLVDLSVWHGSPSGCRGNDDFENTSRHYDSPKSLWSQCHSSFHPNNKPGSLSFLLNRSAFPWSGLARLPFESDHKDSVGNHWCLLEGILWEILAFLPRGVSSREPTLGRCIWFFLRN
jgi:hypothetical protein